jgi:hypothetical protein
VFVWLNSFIFLFIVFTSKSSDFEQLLFDFELLLSNFQLLLFDFELLLSNFQLLLSEHSSDF